MNKGLRRYFKDAFYADQGAALLRRITVARRGAAGRQHAEALHDWRVLTRRLIEFTDLWARRPLRQEVLPVITPWIDATNAARDAEVERALLEKLRGESDGDWTADLDRMTAQADEAARAGEEALAAYLADTARREEECRLEELFAGLPRFPHVPGRLPRRLRQAIRRFLDLLGRHHPDLKSLHRLRLAAKGLRYGLEPLAALDGNLKPVLEELAALQRSLGDHRDWTRLAELGRAAGLSRKLIETMEKHAEKNLAARPLQLKETQTWIADGWQAPPLPARLLRRRLLGALSEEESAQTAEALERAAKSCKGLKRAGGAAALTQPLRVVLSLIEEGGRREPRLLAAALLSALPPGAPPPLDEDARDETLGGELDEALRLLARAAEESGPEGQAALDAAPPWVRAVALARELEVLRHAAESGAGRSEAAARARALLPALATPDGPGAPALKEQFQKLLTLISNGDES